VRLSTRRLRRLAALFIFPLIGLAPLTAQHSPPAAGAPDPAAQLFVDNLLKKMTLDEKISQMSQIPLNQPGPASAEDLARGGKVGSFLFITDPARIDRLQHLAVEQGRLHIPILFGYDIEHGFRTIYPIPLAMASSWDPSVEELAQSMSAKEARASGIHWTFAPMVDIARDPRWGRIMEGAGEDPFLGSKMAAAQVRGFQGDSLDSPDHIMACVKHFAGYGAAVGGRDYEEANISDEQLWNVYLPPFRAAVAAGTGSLMTAYMDLNGVPATADKFLLQDVLRDQWKFSGFVVSDWESVMNLTTHGFSANPGDAAARAVNAGIEMEMTSTTFSDTLAGEVKNGTVQESTIDNAVRDILLAKYKLGLFRNPYINPAAAASHLVTPEQRKTARNIATRSTVLLRNENHLLPLNNSVKSIALIGELGDSKADIQGSWTLSSHPDEAVTVLEGLQRHFGSSVKIAYTKGVEIDREQPSIFDAQYSSPKPTLISEADKAAEFKHAIDLVRKSDVAILVLGELQSMSGERASRATLDLPGKQEELLEAAVAIGKPVVLVLLNGRPLDITWASQHVPAILEAWYSGTEGGNAIADLLTGAANPGGKLPVTWPRSVGQLPLYYAHNLTQIPNDPDTRYWDASSAPLYPFGYGLSYSSFRLGQPRISVDAVKAGTSFDVSVDLENTSAVDGDEVVQLYTHQKYGSASRPVRELKGFRRVSLKAGEKKKVTLTLDTNDLGFWSPQTRRWSIEPSDFDLWVGTSSAATNHLSFRVSP